GRRFSMASALPIAALVTVVAICVRFMAAIARYALTSFTWGRLLDSKIQVSHADLLPFLLQAEQRGVAAGGRGVDRERALGGEAMQIARAAGLGASAREALAAEGLHADDGADHVAVDIGVADAQPLMDVAHGRVDPAVDTKGEAVAGGVHVVQHLVEAVTGEMDDVQDRPEHFAIEARESIDAEGARRYEAALLGLGCEGCRMQQLTFRSHPLGMRLERRLRRLVDDRTNVRRKECRIA